MVATLDRFSLEGGIQGMKKFFVTLLVGLAALGAAWAQEGTQEAAVRVVHLVPNGPNVDITLNGEAALQGLAAGTVSGYVSVPAGQYDVEVIAAGGTVAAEPGAQAETPAGDVGAVGTEVDAVGAELGEAGNELEQAVTGGAAEVEQAVTGRSSRRLQAALQVLPGRICRRYKRPFPPFSLPSEKPSTRRILSLPKTKSKRRSRISRPCRSVPPPTIRFKGCRKRSR